MPTTTTRMTHQPSRRDSWPPTQMRIFNSIESESEDMDMDHHDNKHHNDHHHHHHHHHHHSSYIGDDEDPMNSFLTPTPLLDDGDTDDEDTDMDMDFAFDAGIEDPHNPAPIVRSISPSKLAIATGGLPRPPSTPPRAIPVPMPICRAPSPRTVPHHLRPGSASPPSRTSTPEIATPMLLEDDDQDEEEDYVRLTPSPSPSFSSPRGGNASLLPPPSFNNNLGSSKSRASKMRRAAKAAAVAAAKVQEKEEDKVALMMARGYHQHYHQDNDSSSSLSSSSLLAPSPEFHVGRPPLAAGAGARGRSTKAFGRPAPPPLSRPNSWSGANGFGNGRLSPRAWREPSPDVWSIEEEDESQIGEEDVDDMDVHAIHRGAAARKHKEDKSQKRVRFAWPVREEIP